jgi:hypothetical protein
MLRRFILVIAVLASGCAATPPATQDLQLRLSPASLGREMVLQQRLTVSARGTQQQFDMALEVDAASVRMVVLGFGQVLARLQWDGRELQQQRVAGWPDALGAERVLTDLQLVHWPQEAVRAALPPGWSLAAQERERILRWQGKTVIHVHYPEDLTTELENIPAGYTVRMQDARGRP